MHLLRLAGPETTPVGCQELHNILKGFTKEGSYIMHRTLRVVCSTCQLEDLYRTYHVQLQNRGLILDKLPLGTASVHLRVMI